MLLTQYQLRSLLFEHLLLEAAQQEIIKKYPKLDIQGYVDAINAIKNKNKYLPLLDVILTDYLTSRDFTTDHLIRHGEIIFMVLMHEKYANSQAMPNEDKDVQGIKEYSRMVQIIDDLDAKFFAKNSSLYDSLVRIDASVTEDYKAELENREIAEEDNDSISLEQDVRPGLKLLQIIDGWQILLPMNLAGAKAIGVREWCTVYSDAWLTYNNMGNTLFYVARDQDYDRLGGYGYDYDTDPYNYISIGFKGNDIYIPSGTGELSVWGDQAGVTYNNLARNLGKETSEKIIAYITEYFNRGQGLPSGNSSDPEASAAREFRRQQGKLARAIGRNKRIFEQYFYSIGNPNERAEFVLDTLVGTELSQNILELIMLKYCILNKDSVLMQSDAYKAGEWETIVVGLYMDVHMTPTDDFKNKIVAWLLEENNRIHLQKLLDFNFYDYCKPYLSNESGIAYDHVNSHMNYNLFAKRNMRGINVENYLKMFNLIPFELIQTYEDWDISLNSKLSDFDLNFSEKFNFCLNTSSNTDKPTIALAFSQVFNTPRFAALQKQFFESKYGPPEIKVKYNSIRERNLVIYNFLKLNEILTKKNQLVPSEALESYISKPVDMYKQKSLSASSNYDMLTDEHFNPFVPEISAIKDLAKKGVQVPEEIINAIRKVKYYIDMTNSGPRNVYRIINERPDSKMAQEYTALMFSKVEAIYEAKKMCISYFSSRNDVKYFPKFQPTTMVYDMEFIANYEDKLRYTYRIMDILEDIGANERAGFISAASSYFAKLQKAVTATSGLQDNTRPFELIDFYEDMRLKTIEVMANNPSDAQKKDIDEGMAKVYKKIMETTSSLNWYIFFKNDRELFKQFCIDVYSSRWFMKSRQPYEILPIQSVYSAIEVMTEANQDLGRITIEQANADLEDLIQIGKEVTDVTGVDKASMHTLRPFVERAADEDEDEDEDWDW